MEVDTNRALGDQDCSIYEDVFILYIYTYTYDYTHSMYIHALCVCIYIYSFIAKQLPKVPSRAGLPPFRGTWLDFLVNIFIFAHGYLDSWANKRRSDPLHELYHPVHLTLKIISVCLIPQTFRVPSLVLQDSLQDVDLLPFHSHPSHFFVAREQYRRILEGGCWPCSKKAMV